MGGLFSIAGQTVSNVVLLEADGTLDSSFESLPSAGVHTFALDRSNYGVYMGGDFLFVDGFERRRTARLGLTAPSICNTSYPIAVGTLDANFNPNADRPINAL